MVKFLGLYDAGGSILDFSPFRTSTCGGKTRVTEIPGGAPPPSDLPGGKARVTEIPEGGFAPPDPPTTTFQKICPPGKFFEMIEIGGAPPAQIHLTEKKRLWRRTGGSSTEIVATRIVATATDWGWVPQKSLPQK